MNPELDKLDANNKAVTIEVTVQELNTIFAALGEMPHRVSDPIMRKVFEQASKQLPKT
jgi:hypothetical protein